MATTMMAVSKTSSEVVTETQSLALMKNLLRVGVSSVCWLRNLFPESCFSQKDYLDMKPHCLEPHYLKEGKLVVVNAEAHAFGRWLEQGVFDALQKKYLRQLVLAIVVLTDDKVEKVIESYTWKFTYPSSGEYAVKLNGPGTTSLCASSKEELKNQAKTLIRSLISFSQTLPPLPDERLLTLKLLYYDDVTPVDYQPQFFKDCSPDSLSFDETERALRIRLGQVSTPHHALDFKYSGTSTDGDATTPASQPVDATPSAVLMETGDADDQVTVRQSQDSDDAASVMTEKLAEVLDSVTLVEERGHITESDLEKVKDQCKQFPKAWLNVRTVGAEAKVDLEIVKEAFNRLADEGFLHRTPWGKKTRFRLTESAVTSGEVPCTPPQQKQQQRKGTRVSTKPVEAHDENTPMEDQDAPDVPMSQMSQESTYRGRKASRTEPMYERATKRTRNQ